MPIDYTDWVFPPPTPPDRCLTCGGDGQILFKDGPTGNLVRAVRCPACEGRSTEPTPIETAMWLLYWWYGRARDDVPAVATTHPAWPGDDAEKVADLWHVVAEACYEMGLPT